MRMRRHFNCNNNHNLFLEFNKKKNTKSEEICKNKYKCIFCVKNKTK